MKLMREIVFASNNIGKFYELSNDFENANLRLIFHKPLNLIEDEQTLVANSYSKAKSAALQTGKMAIGDDSGIFITELDYFPGVHSRRWLQGSDLERNLAILKMMEGIENRECFLISRFTLVDKEGKKLFTTAVKNRFEIATEIRGDKGFGYDPILIVPELGKTMGELNQQEKNKAANRGRIAVEIQNYFKEKTK